MATLPTTENDAQLELIRRRREIETAPVKATPDEQELAEREAAAQAYVGESEQHFVDYVMDCIKQSVQAHRNIRRIQALCWNAYEENEPMSWVDKEDWQARTIIPKPHQTVQFGASAIKKAFSPNFLTIENPKNKQNGEFWKKEMDFQFEKPRGNFVLRFADAVCMALAVGTSQEIIPRYVPGKGLEFALVEPWKIHRDPDAISREPQSGMYWIHQEWLDYHVLQEGEANGRYFNVARVKEAGSADPENPLMTKEAIAARKQMIVERSAFRKSILSSEFWGQVLSPGGELLLDNATYTIAANRVIQLPMAATGGYRWPGISFSPMPHLLRHDGRGLLEGVLSLWEAMNNILCLHQDYIHWIVNPPREINLSALDDPEDVKIFPGKDILTRETAHGQQAVRLEQRRSRTSDILANMQHYDQMFDRGSFVTSRVQGLPGWRKQEPFRLAAMDLDQALAVFGLMGENVEEGAIQVISLAAKVVKEMAGYSDYEAAFTEEELKQYGLSPDTGKENGVTGVPELEESFHVSGIQALMRDNETLAGIKETIIPLSNVPGYAPYINKFRVLKAIEGRINIKDEGIIPTDEEAKVINLQERLAAAKQQEAAEKLAELQEAMGITELIEKLGKIEAETGGDIAGITERIMALEGGGE